MTEGKEPKARRQRRARRPKSRSRLGGGSFHRFGKRNRVLKHLAKAGALLQSENVLPFRLVGYRGH